MLEEDEAEELSPLPWLSEEVAEDPPPWLEEDEAEELSPLPWLEEDEAEVSPPWLELSWLLD